MISYGVSVRLDTASPALGRIRTGLTTKAFRPAVGEAMMFVLMEHFTAKEADPASHATATRLGARPTGVYSQFSRSTSWALSQSGVSVSVEHPAIRQRLNGGTITPSNGRTFLTIPANAAAYGKKVSNFGDQIKFRPYKDKTTGERKGLWHKNEKKPAGMKAINFRPEVYFWAVRSVDQPADPSVLPRDDEFFRGIDDAVGDWIEEQTNG